ncbi:hypothetical protein C5167_002376 [Papaver somniferum]|uniref:Structure-specific endonuclease subunit SLX1 homolog n=1 Tax=Papaver somniferum TaxID=3469 RepID=A0A4Y7L0Q6_PAPSO|nr:uncharacterized protein LOC113309502 isoform X1 [Papaver somniferum]RZC78210.1 hypothetical protein C5167_002376 [Papaver somniferum]
MRKRKERTTKERSETLICNSEEGNEEREYVEEDEGKRFYACYLLCSLCPRFKGHTYIGYTVDPCRRIRQHNGEKTNGAVRTKRKRPWEMMLCIYGFPTNVSALQFEWAWQHPIESLAVRQAALSFKSLSGIANHVKLAYTMLNLPPWRSLKLTVNFFSTAYTKHAAGSPSLPKQMKVQVCSMDELPCYIGDSQVSDEIDDEEEWEHEDAGNGIGEISQSERSKDISVENSVVYQNTDYDWETLIESSVANPDIYHDWERLIEDDSLQQQKGSCRLREEEDNERPSRDIDSSPERSKDISVENSVVYQNTDYDWETLIENSVANPDIYHDCERLIEDDSLQQQKGSCRLREEEDDERPSRDIDSSPEALSTRIARLVNRRQLVEESYPYGLFTETGNKLGPTTKQLLTAIAGASGNQAPPSYRYLCPPEVAFTETGEKLGPTTKQIPTTTAVASGNQAPPCYRYLSRPEVAVRQPKETLTPIGARLLSFVTSFPLQTPSSAISRFVNTVQATEDRDSFELIEETGSELGRASTQQTTITSAREDHSLSKNSPHCPPEVCFREPMDLFSSGDKQGKLPLCVDLPMEKPSSSIIEFPYGMILKGCVNKMKETNEQQLRTPAGYNYNQPTSSASTSCSSPEVQVINLLSPEGGVNKMKEANKQQLRTPVGYNYNQPRSSSSTSHSSPEVEVINLLTPSPDCNTHSLNSKKRHTLVHRDIVDLTRSPLFVQL